MNLQIRIPQNSDKQQWLALWQGYLEFYKEQLPQEITNATWERMLATDEKMYGFVAFDGDAMVGFVNYIFHRSTWAKGYYCYLEDLYVADEARRKGVAKALIQAVRKAANENNCERLYWVTGESNTVAKALYDKIAEKTEYFQYRLSLD
jgi:GNAT superfamily N-acetyltransferase